MDAFRKKLFTTFGLLVLLGLLPIGCGEPCNHPCGCSPSFEVKDFWIRSFETLSLTTEGQQVSPTTTLPYSSITKSFRIKEIETIALEKSASQNLPGFAFACSPPSPKSADRLVDVMIYNSKEVSFENGTVLKVGQELSEFFLIGNFFSAQSQTIEDFLSQPRDIYMEDLFKLTWNLDPGKEVQLQFSLRIILENGKEFILNEELLSIH
ncbi:hypothetical protein [Algoriphagus sp. CAU 1675]|uniref:hypothetical protein n=1 Tax=Algoriphagus sp. CAU 1675 TaxID=3032597 RepID=UPI0023DA8094|nr:hypothetical protein [Algoriphagus sp. CAU 1675]MDF2158222.1 hypothetical protein [Algoriphagus sp. CAU 1675]